MSIAVPAADAIAAAPAPEIRFDPRTRALLEAPIAGTLVRLGAPNMLVMLAQSSVGLIETYFVGKLGTDALAGVALVFPAGDADADDVGGRDGRRHLLGDRPRARRGAARRCRCAGAACARHRAGVRPRLHWRVMLARRTVRSMRAMGGAARRSRRR